MSNGSYATRNTIAKSLHDAILRGDCDGVKIILQRLDQEEKRIIVCGLNASGKNALDVAVAAAYSCPQDDIAAMLRMNQAMSEAMSRGDLEGALSFRHPPSKKRTMMGILISAGADISTDCVIHETMHGSYSSRSAALQHATPSAINGINNEGWTALQLALHHNGGYTVLTDLLEAGADPNICGPASHLPLHIAIIHDCGYSVLIKLLEKGADPNAQNNRGQSSLHLAVKKDVSYSTLDALVSRGANVNLQDAQGLTSLHRLLSMVDDDYSTCVEALIEAPGFDPNVSDPGGLTALHYYAKYGAYDDNIDDDNIDDEDDGDLFGFGGLLAPQQAVAMRQLRAQALQHHRHMQQHMREQRRQMREQRRQMMELMRRQRLRMRQMFNANPFEWEEEDNYDQAGEPNEGDSSIISAMIRAGGDINAVDDNGRPPLFYAAKAGHLEILVALLQAGANPNAGSQSALNAAIATGHVGVLDALIQAGSSVRVIEPRSHDTCMHLAAKHGDDNILGLLLRGGADPNASNRHYVTPLHFAVQARSLPSVENLVSAGANPNALDDQGCTPLHWAARVGDISIWDVLVQSGADVHKQDSLGMTALMRAATKNLKLNSLFLLLGSDPTQLNVTCTTMN